MNKQSAIYPSNMGAEELVLFYQRATPSQIAAMDALLEDESLSDSSLWIAFSSLIKQVLNTNLSNPFQVKGSISVVMESLEEAKSNLELAYRNLKDSADPGADKIMSALKNVEEVLGSVKGMQNELNYTKPVLTNMDWQFVNYPWGGDGGRI